MRFDVEVKAYNASLLVIIFWWFFAEIKEIPTKTVTKTHRSEMLVMVLNNKWEDQ